MKKNLLAIIVVLSIGLSLNGQSDRLVLLEHFTQASCGPCAGVNPTITALLESNADIITAINYHTSWPGTDPMYNHNTTENGARTAYYGVNSVPSSNLDGNVYNGHPNGWNLNTVETRSEVPSPIDIYLHHELSEDESVIMVNMLIQATDDVPAGMKAHNVVIEKLISFTYAPGSNGETEFHNVMKKMLPNQVGTDLPAMTAGDYIILQYAWEHANVYEIDELAAISFVQNNDDKEVLQAANSSEELFSPLFAKDVEILDVNNISYYNCDGMIQPKIEIRNNGSENLTSLSIKYSMNDGEVNTYEWSGDLGFLDSEIILLDESSFVNQLVNTLHIELDSPNGQADDYPSNNVKEIPIEKALLGESTMVLYMILDENPEETSWEVTNYEGDVIYEGGSYTNPGQTILEQLTFESTNCYTFTIYDEGGDGLSQGGSVAFGFGSTYLINEYDFGEKAEAQFKIEFTGINESSAINEVMLVPNPATDQVQISFQLMNSGLVECVLLNSIGKTVNNISLGDVPAGQVNQTIDVSALNSGVYYLQIWTGDNYRTEKLIITK